MTAEQMNAAIAELCGWTEISIGHSGAPIGKKGNETTWIPDYYGSLDDMHEAEKTLNEKEQVWYLQKLTQVRFKAGVGGMIGCMIDKTTFATSRERAEAFLRVKGKWIEKGNS